MAVVVEDDVGGGEVAGLDFIGFELPAGVEDGVEEVPDLDRGGGTSGSLKRSNCRFLASISSLMLMGYIS